MMLGIMTDTISRIPMITRMVCPEIFRRDRTIFSRTIVKPAIDAPIRLPLPPVVAMPPNTHIEMTSISKPWPVVVLAPKEVASMNMAQTPAIVPIRM